ncbi:MAG TPA: DUF4126 domain-containing protein [Gemmatimonadaceae bacterium]|nr:DUF4126 domain-containing protein [Gemmatimonadaceae bacterium]
MSSSATLLAQALGIAYASGVSLYATVGVTGLASRFGLIDLPDRLAGLGSWWVIALALLLYALEFGATLVPGVASAWETVHSLVRPPAAAVLAAATTWHSDPILVVVAALLGGGIAVTTHTTKLGLRYAIDTSPEPVTNGIANTAELGLVAAIALFVWEHPWITLGLALIALVVMVLMVRMIWRMLRRVFSGRWTPGRFLQDARTSDRVEAVEE